MDTAVTRTSQRRDHVLCLHSSLSSSQQWQGLADRLQSEFNVHTPDLIGYGDAPHWAVGIEASLDREIERLADLVDELDGPIHLVGHSYGGAVAIRAAVAFGPRISSLSVYEPVVFQALLEASDEAPATLEMLRLIEQLKADCAGGNLLRAAGRFIDYWSGPGTWTAIPVHKQYRLASQVPAGMANFDAAMKAKNPLPKLAESGLPTLYLAGQDSPEAAQAMGRQFTWQVSHAVRHRFRGTGHMGPITNAEAVNSRIARFVKHRAAKQYRQDYAWAA